MPTLNSSEKVTILCDPTQYSGDAKEIYAGVENTLKNLSGAVLSHGGKYLWLGTDELTAIERFTRQADAPHCFGEQRRFHFRDFVEKFDDDNGEVDVEGLDFDQNHLWMIGSHSSTRRKAMVTADKFQIQDKELKKIQRQKNRYFLGRVPVNAEGEIDETKPQAVVLKRDGRNNVLTKALAQDEYLDLSQCIKNGDDLPGEDFFLYLPSKENGLDIEGLAVDGNRILIGLRGPVLRGLAILLEIQAVEDSGRELKLNPIGPGDQLYKRHFLDLGGLGIRELCWEQRGQQLLILAGPTMDLDGAHALYRLNNPFGLPDKSLSSPVNQQLQHLGEIPHGSLCDRAEGIALYGDQSILVVYDKPAEPQNQSQTPNRLIYNDQGQAMGVFADIFPLT